MSYAMGHGSHGYPWGRAGKDISPGPGGRHAVGRQEAHVLVFAFDKDHVTPPTLDSPEFEQQQWHGRQQAVEAYKKINGAEARAMADNDKEWMIHVRIVGLLLLDLPQSAWKGFLEQKTIKKML